MKTEHVGWGEVNSQFLRLRLSLWVLKAGHQLGLELLGHQGREDNMMDY